MREHFAPIGRVVAVHVEGTLLTFMVSTERFHRVLLSEITRLRTALDVDESRVEFWDVPNGVEFSIDCAERTNPGLPSNVNICSQCGQNVGGER